MATVSSHMQGTAWRCRPVAVEGAQGSKQWLLDVNCQQLPFFVLVQPVS